METIKMSLNDFAVLAHSPATYNEMLCGRSPHPLPTRSIIDRLKGESLVCTVEEALEKANKLGIYAVQALVNPETGKPYGKETKKQREYMAKQGITDYSQALFDTDLAEITEFKHSMLSKLGKCTFTAHQSAAITFDLPKMNAKLEVPRPQVYRLDKPLEDGSVFQAEVVFDITTNWNRAINPYDVYGSRTQVRRGMMASWLCSYPLPVYEVRVELVSPYRMCAIRLGENSLAEKYCTDAAAAYDEGKFTHVWKDKGECWISDLPEKG